jgi:hypothetical protein
MAVVQPLALLLLLPVGGPARAAGVAVLPIEVVDFGVRADGVREQIGAAGREVLGPRYLPVEAPPPCRTDAACLERIARGREADEVAVVRLRRGDGPGRYAEAEIALHDARGQRLHTFLQPIDAATAALDVRALFVRAFDPGRFTGTLEVFGLAPGEALYVDGLQAAGPKLDVSVGPHHVEAVGADGGVRAADVRVSFGQRARVPLPVHRRGSVGRRSPWPLVTTAGTAVGGALIAVGGGVLGASAAAEIETWQKGGSCANVPGYEGVGRDDCRSARVPKEGYGTPAPNGGLTDTAAAAEQARDARRIAALSLLSAHALWVGLAVGLPLAAAGSTVVALQLLPGEVADASTEASP